MAAFGSAILMVCALLSPVGIGIAVILIAEGIIAEWFGPLNPVEEWAYESFWGKSDYFIIGVIKP